jgi:hypothetical protein
MAMNRTVLLGLGLVVLLCAQAYGEEGRLERYGRAKYIRDGELQYGHSYYEPPSTVRGKQGRKYARRFSFRDNLTGDKLAILDAFGYTPHRLGYNSGSQRTERWKYYAEGVEFVFDENSNLIETVYFPPETNHID